MQREIPILEDMVRSFQKLVDLMDVSMGRSREEGRDGRDAESEEAVSESREASVEEQAAETGPRRLAVFLAEAARERAEASRPPDPEPAAVVRPHRVRKVPEGVLEDPEPVPSRDGVAEQPLSLGELPPGPLWYPALILPENRLGAEARHVVSWLEAMAAAAQAKDVDRV